MNHIDTKSDAEKKARDMYKEAKFGEVVADEKVEATVRELLALRHKMDEDELRASSLKAVIMNAMGNMDTLKSASGVKLATWSVGSEKKTVDYKGLFKKYKVTDDDVKSFTRTTVGSRVFSIEEV